MDTTITIRLLDAGDAKVLEKVAAGVFDHPVDPRWATEFLTDPRHHLLVATDSGTLVGIVSAVHYVHPDKPPELFINEVGVAPSHHRQGIARALLVAMLQHGRTLGCTEAWVGTEETNSAANGLYRSVGGTPEPFVLYSFPLNGRPCT